MLKSVNIINDVGQSLKISLGDPEKTGLLITNIEGLGPVNANIATTEISSMDGVHINGTRMSSRNIVFSFILNSYGKETIEEIRQKAYKIFPIKKKSTMIFTTDRLEVYTSGYVESHEPKMFTKTPTLDVSVICPDPYFYSVKDEETIFNGVSAAFEFEYENIGHDPDTIYGLIQKYTETNIYYDGDDENGFTIVIDAIGPIKGLSIHNTVTREFIRIDRNKFVAITKEDLKAGDEIIISTMKGNKRATLLKNGITYNILNAISRDSSWLQLQKGDNLFAYVADEGMDNVQFRIRHNNLYEGI